MLNPPVRNSYSCSQNGSDPYFHFTGPEDARGSPGRFARAFRLLTQAGEIGASATGSSHPTRGRRDSRTGLASTFTTRRVGLFVGQ